MMRPIIAWPGAWLLLILAGALCLRVPAIRWGLPPPLPEVAASDLRCSYAFDEDDVLTPLSFTRPSSGDLDPRMYHWGTFHFELVLLALESAQRLGYFEHPWRTAYYNLIYPDFERVYAAGRMVSVIVALFSIWFVFLLGRQIAGPEAGMWAALLLAVSPTHLLSSTQIRVDLTMTALITLAAWLAIRPSPPFFWIGFVSGLAITAKYPAIFMVVPMAVAALWTRRSSRRVLAALFLGAVCGCLVGQPYFLFRSRQMLEVLQKNFQMSRETPREFLIPFGALLVGHAKNLARFSLGLPAALLAAYGLWWIIRRTGKNAYPTAIAPIAGGLVVLYFMLWPLLRYQLPLLPFLAAAAALALVRLPPRWRWAAGAVAVIFPLAGSFAQLRYMRSPHPANLALPLILKSVPRGTPIARLVVEMPPLDQKAYPMGPNPFQDDLSHDPPAWVLTADLPDQPYPASTMELLKTRYEKIAEFRSQRIFPWATLGEAGAPHDWKYTHPTLTLYAALHGNGAGRFSR